MNYLGANMKLIVECSQKLVRLGENLWGKEQKLDKEMQEHQKLCDEIMAIIEPIEAEMEQIIHCPEGYIFKDENGNVINATKIVLEKKKKEYPKTYEECCKILNIPVNGDIVYAGNWVYGGEYLDKHLGKLRNFQKLLICLDAYWKLYGEEMGLGKPWEPDWKDGDTHKFNIHVIKDEIRCGVGLVKSDLLSFPTEEMRDAFYENFKKEIEICKELL